MYVEVKPEPSEDERQAILEALKSEQAAGQPAPWRRAGLEPPEDDED